MISIGKIVERYKTNLKDIELLISQEKNSLFRLSVFRLLLFLFLIIFLILVFSDYQLFYLLILFGIITSFGFVIRSFFKTEALLQTLNCKKLIIENEIRVVNYGKNENYNGWKFKDKWHDYSEDLDVFGPDSIFEKINRCRTKEGLNYLSTYLGVLPKLADITRRQGAIQELERMQSWVLDFMANIYGIDTNTDDSIVEKLENALKVDTSFTEITIIKWYRRFLPIFWLGFLLSYLIEVNLNYNIAIAILLLNFVISILFSKKVGQIQNVLSFINKNIGIYLRGAEAINQYDWKSIHLADLQQQLKSDRGVSYVQSLRDLKKLADLLDYRMNMIVSIFLNLGLLWDVYLVDRLNHWKKKNSLSTTSAIGVVGEMECLISLSVWSYHHRDCAFPEITHSYFELKAKGIIHPLMNIHNAVPNDFSIDKGKYISLVTGSNMSGKSTFLRSLGLNMILGNSGTRICAEHFEYSLSRIISYMRISDALEENTSTFKAELIRVKRILQATRAKERVFIIADEMLRGTNSKDKVKGAKAIIAEIHSCKSYGVFATHDLELTNMELNGLTNYHFDISFDKDDLVFDYKIRPGICSSFNASYLLSRLGLDVDVQ